MPCICKPPLEIHKHLMSVSWVAACLTLLTTLSYCHTPHRTAADCGMTARWQLCLRVCVWVPDHTSHTHTLSVCTYGAGVWGVCGSGFRSVCVFARALAIVSVFNMVVKCLSGPISHLPSAQINWRAAKANRHKDRAEGITMQRSGAVCPDPVWGPLLSADSNELPRD